MIGGLRERNTLWRELSFTFAILVLRAMVRSIAKAAERGDWDEMRRLVERADDPNAVDSEAFRQTVLHFAARKGSKAICELLLKRGANINAKDSLRGDVPLHEASRNGSAAVCKLLVAHGADVTAVNNNGCTPLMSAVINCQSPTVCHPLITSDSVNVAIHDGDQALHIAARTGHTLMVQLLMEHGADTSTVNKHKQTPLHTAAGGEKDCPELCEILLKHGAKMDAVDKDGNQPLHLACKQGHSGTEKLLVDYGADVTATNVDGHTPVLLVSQQLSETKEDGAHPNVKLHVAAKTGDVETVQQLVDSGADVNAVIKRGRTLLHTVADGWLDCPELCDMLWKDGGRIDAVDEDGNQPLHLACRQSHTKIVKWLLCHDVDTNAMNKHKQSPLHMAAGGRKDCPDLCKDLLDHGANTNVFDENGDQPLHLACKHGHVNTGKELMSHGADTNAVNKLGQTPLHTTAGGWKDSPELCKGILEHGADIDVVDENGDQPLHLACQHGHVNTGKELMSHGADTNAVNKLGQTPLHTTAGGWKDSPELCKGILEHGADIDVVDENGDQPLHLACQHGHVNTGKELMSHGADTNAVNKLGQTPLHTTAGGWKDSPELCKGILEHGADIDVVDENGDQPLHLACQHGHVNTGKELMSHGADTNAVNKLGQTPLHTTAGGWKDSPELCKGILEHGADIDVVDENGDQPLHLACKRGHINTVKVLLSCGANVSCFNNQGKTPLHCLSLLWAGDKSPAVSSLFTAGFDVNIADADGNGCLHLACEAGVISTVQFLLDCNADVLSINNDRKTPLHKAACCGKDCPEVCLLLMGNEAEVNSVDNNEDTPLHVALQQRNIKAARALMENGTDCKVLNVHGETVLHSMGKGGVNSQELCKDLISCGANPHITDKEGNLPIHVALKNNCFKTFLLLFEQWGRSTLADLQKVNTSHIGQLLCVAVNQCDYDSCKKLLGYGANVNVVNKVELQVRFMGSFVSGVGSFPIHLSVAKNDLNLCCLLLDHEACVNAQIPQEHRNISVRLAQPLHLAVYWGYIDICQLLIERGAHLNAKMENGRSPLHIAVVGNKEAIVRLLLSHGAMLDDVKIKGASAVERSAEKGTRSLASLLHHNGQ